MSELTLTNSLTKSYEVFTPIKSGYVGLYSCGPTVYNFPHIGNYRAYLFNDTLARTLAWRGYEVAHIMNITDVDDKTIRDSRKEGISLNEFTKRYTTAFFEDLASLNITSITRFPRATDHIDEMIELIQKLIDRGHAYKSDDGSIYFSIKSNMEYGRLAHLERQSLRLGASGRIRLDEYTKDQIHDFALWKAWSEDDGDSRWDSPWGHGRPGWHIECSVMSMKYLGSHFDIHAGGADLLFPHHVNEIAQSECATGEPFVNYWIHNAWLLVDGKKMAKRDGNFYTLRDLVERGYDLMAYRFFCLSSHYRQPLNFTFDALDAAAVGYRNLIRDCAIIKKAHLGNDSTTADSEIVRRFTDALYEDLNTPKALSVLFEYIKDFYRDNDTSIAKSVHSYATICALDRALGLKLADIQEEKIPDAVCQIAKERQNARMQKDWEAADRLRQRIEDLGWKIDDTDNGYRLWRL